jgi:hypothetical protein
MTPWGWPGIRPHNRSLGARIVSGARQFLSRRGQPPGCLGLNGAMACSAEAEPIRLALVDGRRRSEAALARRLREAEPPELHGMTPKAHSRYVMTVSQGLAAQSKAGCDGKAIGKDCGRCAPRALSIGSGRRRRHYSQQKYPSCKREEFWLFLTFPFVSGWRRPHLPPNA